ncbi:putative transposable element tc3 transposase [Blattamonas nauphoetae]|uniref:Transposable element tc3 transposase n=1 Tax=Blattamonas nauphoetae TaxID=2049346 RepID=A0ABQ9XM64_9EUKA|nr:putative transposable element tc3 transposase [Blattamonas nauphoetae]
MLLKLFSGGTDQMRPTIERPVRTEEALEAVSKSVHENPTLSVRHRSALLEDETLIVRIWFRDECSFDLTKSLSREKNAGPVYRSVLNDYLFPALRKRTNFRRQFFMQDGASPHTALETGTFLNHALPNRWIGMIGTIEWRARSPDMTPCDFFWWGHLFDKMYAHSPDTLEELKNAIRTEMGRISIEMCQNAVRSFQARVAVLLDRNGAHVEL